MRGAKRALLLLRLPLPATTARRGKSTLLPSLLRVVRRHDPRAPHPTVEGHQRQFTSSPCLSSASSSSSPPPPASSPPPDADVADPGWWLPSATPADPETAAAARQAFFSLLEPADAAQAAMLLDSAEAPVRDSVATLAEHCNFFLTGLARSRDAVLLRKAFGYLGKFRGALPAEEMQGFPNVCTRFFLIRACGNCVRGIRQVLEQDVRRPSPQEARLAAVAAADEKKAAGDAREWAGEVEDPVLFSSLSSSSMSRATMAMYSGLAEALFNEALASFHAANPSLSATAGMASALAPPVQHLWSLVLYPESETWAPDRQIALLLGEMLYTYTQAGESRKAIDLFDGLWRRRPVGILPNEYCIPAILKAVAEEKGPEEALDLWLQLERAGAKIENVRGVERAVLRSVVRALGEDPPNAGRLRATALAVLSRMREKGTEVPVDLLRWWIHAESLLGHHRGVKAVMAEMRRHGQPPGALEYAFLFRAMSGEGARPGTRERPLMATVQEMRRQRERMAAEGVAADEGVCLALLRFYDKYGDAGNAKAAFKEGMRLVEEKWPGRGGAKDHDGDGGGGGGERRRVGLRHPELKLHTAWMGCLLRAGNAQQVLDLFASYRHRSKGSDLFAPPDQGMCAVVLRAAAAVGGPKAAQRLYDELRAEARAERWHPFVLRGAVTASLLSAYVDEGDWDAAYALFEQARERRGQRAAGGDGRRSPMPYNVMINGLVKASRREEAQRVAELAQADGVKFDKSTYLSLAKAGPKWLVPWAKDDWQPPAHVYLVGGDKEEGEEEADDGGGALVLDLHGLSTPQVTELLARELAAMRAAFDAAEAAAKRRAAAKVAGGLGGKEGEEEEEEEKEEKEEEEEEEEEDDDGLRDLVLITGFHRRRRYRHLARKPAAGAAAGGGQEEDEGNGKEAAVKAVVRELLGARGLLFVPEPGNAGRFRVSKASMREYFERERKAEEGLRFFRLTLLRYIPVASLMALVFLTGGGAGLPL